MEILRSNNLTPQTSNGRIEGYAMVWYNGEPGTEFQTSEHTFERINPAGVVLDDNVYAAFNHNVDYILGRFPKTLQVQVDRKGLWYSITPSNTRHYQDVVEMISRGDLLGSSVRGKVAKDRWTLEGSKAVNVIEAVKILEVGPVNTPAYTDASVMLRYNSWIDEQKKLVNKLDKIQAYLELLYSGGK